MLRFNLYLWVAGGFIAGSVIVLVILATGELNHLEQWCQAHNGTVNVTQTIHCKLPNGTVVKQPPT